ncbi:TPA: restriction endonuclease subunit S [Salmonella enterica subsp. enterica serovar Albany]|nr:restriction endonuclease subunit S [Salmonella enterica subsp. enterica serovar Albany]
MSTLSYLDKLLDGVEVEWLTASEIFNIKNGYTPSKAKKEFWEDGNIPWFRLEDIRTNGRELNDSILYVNQAGVKGNLFPKDSIFMSTTATIGEFALVKIPHLTNQQITNFSLKNEFEEIVDIKYLFYRFHHFGEWCKENANKSGGLSIIGIKKLSSYKFPIPCPDNPEKSLAIQSEIVRILDTFTALTAELSTRKKQYNYYRDQLLSFEDGEVEWRTLGELGVLIRGKRFVKTDIIPKGVPCIHYGEMYTHYSIWADKAKSYISTELASKLRKATYGDVVFVSAGETIADIGRGTAWLGDEDVVIHDACFFYKSSLNPKYVAYFSRTNFFHDQIKKSISSGKISAINAKGLEKVIIPVPSPEAQARIVAILDKFDTLTSSITEGLPREIALRQKQYEHYRDLLFSFPKPEVAID